MVGMDVLRLGIYLTSVLFGGFAAIWIRLGNIEKRNEHFVDFDTCAKKRKDCPCASCFLDMQQRLATLEARP